LAPCAPGPIRMHAVSTAPAGAPDTGQAKEIGRASAGLPHTDHKLQQFLLNDRKAPCLDA
jgi:hypothetical protein